MTRIWRHEAKRVSSNSKEKSERIPSGMTNNKMTNLTTKPPHQIETSRKQLEEAMKIEEVPDTARLPTWNVSPEPITTIDKNDEIVTTEREYQELRSMQQAFKSIKNWNYLQPGREMEWLTITQDFLRGFPNINRNCN